MKYTNEMIKYIRSLVDQNYTWSTISDKFNEKNNAATNGEGLRKAYAYRAIKEEQLETYNARNTGSNRSKKPRAEKTKDNSVVLVISDMHAPYVHPDTVAFLKAIKEKYKPTRVISSGDEVDKHNLSYHDSDPDLPNAGDELEQAVKFLKPVYKMFPEMDILDSNHGSLLYRKGITHGIPRAMLRDPGEILGAPDGWQWHNDLRITLPNGQMCFFTHGSKKNSLQFSNTMGCNTVQGHYHSTFEIQYSSNPTNLLWGMVVGCLIDPKSRAFAYNKIQVARPIIGVGMIINSQPLLIPMILNNKGRWTKKL